MKTIQTQEQVKHLLGHPSIANQTRPDFVSEKYGFVRTVDALNMMADHGWTASSVQLQKARNIDRTPFVKHKITLINTELRGNDQDSVPTITLINSHDRSSAFSFNIGFFRFICENGLMVGESLGAAFKVFHSGRDLETNVYRQLVAAVDAVPKALEIREKLRSTQLDNLTHLQLAETLVQTAEQVRGIKIDRASVFLTRRLEDQALDAWTQFNVMQENLTGALTGEKVEVTPQGEIRRKIRARSVKAIDANTKLNKALFDSALNFLRVG